MNLELEKAVLRGMEDLDGWSPPHLRAKAVIDSIKESGFGIVDGRAVRSLRQFWFNDDEDGGPYVLLHHVLEQMGEDE
jgi:hypothetical protein